MHTPATPLLPLFRSIHQGELLALVLLDPDAEHSLSDLARRLGVHHTTVNREVDRLELAGLFRSRRVGNLRLVRGDPASPVLAEVRALALKTLGPAYVLAQELDQVQGAEAAWIYGSWAERASGQPGPPPQDLDVLVVGTPDRNAVDRAARAAQVRLGIEVNAIVRSTEAWAASKDGFLTTLRAGPMLPIPLGRDGSAASTTSAAGGCSRTSRRILRP
ncbi:MAG: MarR family transcriptional regulator [Candidatus Dormiibacterota bacterium]